MAINSECGRCGATFVHSASDARFLCRKCDGTEDRERAEADRWAALTADQKADELLRRVKALERQGRWDGRIG